MNSNCLETIKGALLHVEKIQDERNPSGVWSVELSRFAQMLTKCITEEQKRMNDTKPAPQGWIDIKERKPENRQLVLIAYNDGGIYMATWDSSEPTRSSLTHWMPVPPLPKQDPFEEWWRDNFHRCPPGDLIKPHEDYKACWNAGVQWARKNAAEFDEKLAKLEKERDKYARQGDHGRATATQSDIDELIRKEQ